MESEKIGVIVENLDECQSDKKAFVFNESGGYIGSHYECDFCIQDREGEIRDRHVKISFEEGCFTITPVGESIAFYNGSFSKMQGGYGTIINPNDKLKIGGILLCFVEPHSITDEMLNGKSVLEHIDSQDEDNEIVLKPRGQISVDFMGKNSVEGLLSTKEEYDFISNNPDSDKEISHPILKTDSTEFNYPNILKSLDRALNDIKSNQKSAKLNDIYGDISIKDLESIITSVPLIKSPKLINVIVLTLLTKELYNPIFEEMEEDMFVTYFKAAIQGNLKNEQHLFENLVLKALEKYKS